MNPLRRQTNFEQHQAFIDDMIPALRFYKQHKDQVFIDMDCALFLAKIEQCAAYLIEASDFML